MTMDIANGEPNIMEWDENQVHRWLSSIGFSQYEAQIKGAIRLISDK
jgi:bZIP factor